MKSKWDKISLFQFQQIDIAQKRTDISDLDKSLFSVCAIYGMTEFELDGIGYKKATKLLWKAAKIIDSSFLPIAKNRIGLWFIDYDFDNFTYGQFMELAFFLSSNPTMQAHNVLASISHRWKRKNRSADHAKKAQYFLKCPVLAIMGSLNKIKASYADFLSQYKSFFGLDPEVHGSQASVDPFNKRYGWMYSAKRIAAYERITLDEAYGLPVRRAFHDLIYLKAESKYEAEQLKLITNTTTTENGR
jgi:hypothetical protein